MLSQKTDTVALVKAMSRWRSVRATQSLVSHGGFSAMAGTQKGLNSVGNASLSRKFSPEAIVLERRER
jgi:hypothetical protein